jgi:WD40 repeat protein
MIAKAFCALIIASSCVEAQAQVLIKKIAEVSKSFGSRQISGPIRFSPDGRTLACIEREGGPNHRGVELWDLVTGKELILRRHSDPQIEAVRTLAYSKDGNLLAADDGISGVTVWNIVAKADLFRVASTRMKFVDGIAFADSDKMLVTLQHSISKADDEFSLPKSSFTVVRYEIPTGLRRSSTELGDYFLMRANSDDGRFAVFENPNRSLTLVDLANGQKILALTQSYDFVFSADSKMLVGYRPGHIEMWASESGRQVKHFMIEDGLHGSTSELSLSRDQGILAMARRDQPNQVSIVSLQTGKHLGIINCGPASTICKHINFSPTERLLASQTDSVNTQDKYVVPIIKLWKIPDSW